MRIKLDENLPTGLVPLLAALGHDVHSVRDEALSGQADARYGTWLSLHTDNHMIDMVKDCSCP
jgi:hypothetical protein